MITVVILTCILILTSLFSMKFKDDNFMDRESTDVIRGITILGIALHHTYKLGVVWSVFGSLGTAIFFALSGYGNYYSLRKIGGGTDGC